MKIIQFNKPHVGNILQPVLPLPRGVHGLRCGIDEKKRWHRQQAQSKLEYLERERDLMIEDPEGSYSGRRQEAWEIERLPDIESDISHLEEYLRESEEEVVVAAPLAA